MWVLMDTGLRGFSDTSTRSPSPNPVFATRGEMSEMELLSRSSRYFRLVNPFRGEMSDMELLLRSRTSHVNPFRRI